MGKDLHLFLDPRTYDRIFASVILSRARIGVFVDRTGIFDGDGKSEKSVIKRRNYGSYSLDIFGRDLRLACQ